MLCWLLPKTGCQSHVLAGKACGDPSTKASGQDPLEEPFCDPPREQQLALIHSPEPLRPQTENPTYLWSLRTLRARQEAGKVVREPGFAPKMLFGSAGLFFSKQSQFIASPRAKISMCP